MSDAPISSPVAAQGAGGLLPGATVADVSSQNCPAGSHGSAGAFWRAPIYDALVDALEAERDAQGGIRSWAEIRQRNAVRPPPKPPRARKPSAGALAKAAARAEAQAVRYAGIVQALQARPLNVSLRSLQGVLKARHRTLREIAKAEGISTAWEPIKKPVVKRVRVCVPRQPRPSRNVPKQPEVQRIEIPCICCKRWFKSWDRKFNRLCQPCKDNA